MSNPAAEALVHQIERKIERLVNDDDHGVLGLRQGAGPEEIEGAHELLSRWFDPDRVEAMGLAGLRVLAEHIVRRLDEARRELLGPFPARTLWPAEQAAALQALSVVRRRKPRRAA